MEQLTHFIEQLVKGWVGGLEQSGYLGVFILMAIESSIIPLPSEIVMIPAGVLVAEGKLNLTGVILAGTFGSLAGALFNYYLALLLGRAVLLRYGKYFFLPAEKLLWVEKHWGNHGEMTTFVCRLLPVIRHLISLPAGLTRMHLGSFCLWTTLGAGVWVSILTFTGYLLGDRALQLWHEHKGPISLGLFAAGGLLVLAYVVKHMRAKPAATTDSPSSSIAALPAEAASAS